MIVFDGQSFNNQPAAVATDKPFNVRTMTLLAERGVRAGMVNVGIGGTSYTTRASTVVARADQFPPQYWRSIYVDFSGAGDLGEGKTAAQILALAEANADARKAAGADKVIVCTIPPSTDAWYTAPMNVQREAYNDLLRVNTNNKIDAIVDLDALPHVQDPADPVYFTDGIHPTNLLAQEFAVLTDQALASVGV